MPLAEAAVEGPHPMPDIRPTMRSEVSDEEPCGLVRHRMSPSCLSESSHLQRISFRVSAVPCAQAYVQQTGRTPSMLPRQSEPVI